MFSRLLGLRIVTPLALASVMQPLAVYADQEVDGPINEKPRNSKEAIIAAAKKLNLSVLMKCYGWVILLSDGKTDKKIIGHNFDINPQAAASICNDKAATSAVLTEYGVPNVDHEIFLTPAASNWVKDTGVFTKVFERFESYGGKAVIKPTKDTSGGCGVYLCSNKRELEGAMLRVLSKNGSFVLSPYLPIENEFRAIMLDGEPKVVYKKVRPFVVGDGVSRVGELLLKRAAEKGDSGSNLVSKAVLNTDLEYVPAMGEVFNLNWKHNLAGGATASTDISEEDMPAIQALAAQAMRALGMRFASVDIIKSEGKYLVLEVNSGVMIEKAPGSIQDGFEMATSIYSEAIKHMFNEQDCAEGLRAQETLANEPNAYE